DILDMVFDFGRAERRAIAFDIHVAPPLGDDEDALTAAAVGRLDDEIGTALDDTDEVLRIVYRTYHPIQFRYRDARRHGQPFGLYLVIYTAVQCPRITGHDVSAVALIDADDAGGAE